MANLFTVGNHHSEECGTAPEINGDEAGVYSSYFENSDGEQFVFQYQRSTGEAVLRGGDLGWDESYEIPQMAGDIVLNDAEFLWLMACCMAVGIDPSAMQKARAKVIS